MAPLRAKNGSSQRSGKRRMYGIEVEALAAGVVDCAIMEVGLSVLGCWSKTDSCCK